MYTSDSFCIKNESHKASRSIYTLTLIWGYSQAQWMIFFDYEILCFASFSHSLAKRGNFLPPFDIDETDETNHGPAGVGEGFFDADLAFNPIHYRNSFISIVMGAFAFDKDGYHLHSSTFNPMYCGHPIIQFAPYKTLEVMKQK